MSDSTSVSAGNGIVTRVSVNLTITNASREDTGVYTCLANNSVGSDNRSVNVTVQCKFSVLQCMYLEYLFSVQSEVVKELVDLVENQSNLVLFSCQTIGEPLPAISWYFNDVMINSSDENEYNISTSLNGTVVTSILTVVNAQSSDVGTYTCIAENIIDDIVRNDSSSGHLQVNGQFALIIMLFDYSVI